MTAHFYSMQLSVRRKPSESIQSLQKASSLWEREMCTAEFCSANYQDECPTSSSGIHENIVKCYPCYLPYPTNHITGYHFDELVWYSSGVGYIPWGDMSGGTGYVQGRYVQEDGYVQGVGTHPYSTGNLVAATTHTVGKRAVCILLECILVIYYYLH